MGEVRLELTNSNEGGFTDRCNCHYAIRPYGKGQNRTANTESFNLLLYH